MKMWVLLSLLCLAACSNSKNSGPNPSAQGEAIINGKTVQSGSNIEKATVALVLVEADRTTAFCTGTLISKDLVVTAAHCLNQYLAGAQVQISFGAETFDSRNEGELRVIDRAITYQMVHPPAANESGSINNLNDVALIKLLTPAPKSAVPVPVLVSTNPLNVGQEVVLAGFGQTIETEVSMPKFMQQTRVKISKLTEKLIEVDQTGGTGACWGDSGGPAFLETKKGLVVVGATSGCAQGAADCHHQVVYSSFAGFKDFLQTVSAVLGGEAPNFVNE